MGFKTPFFFKVWFAICALGAIAILVFNIAVFKDCTAHGHAMYQCAAAMQNSHYIAVENIGEGD